ncbi:hypothetical protein PI124_g19023 [Phytophthora idaei]|nr:hypothetical protein PI125_g19356 [Phytophthora idaei]KAG3136373.1 hypothetical protein PI126_g17848 [Phytophthora idaei]KAG3235954.1 hypothetical protein PI124_g19023 [Phytophthora idaei]
MATQMKARKHQQKSARGSAPDFARKKSFAATLALTNLHGMPEHILFLVLEDDFGI